MLREPMLIDAHCHLDSFDDPRAVVRRAADRGVQHLIVNGLWRSGATHDGFGEAVTWAEEDPAHVSATAAIHPHDVAEAPSVAWARLEALARHPRIVAIGETGLDYHYDHSPRGMQREFFRRTIALAREVRKPIVVHLREADEDALTILREERAGEIGGQIHCFSGGPDQARAYLDLGFHLSFSGIVTYKTAELLRDAARITPLDRMLIETDSPYLAPVPYRGKTNEPAYLHETSVYLARLLGLAWDELARVTRVNAIRLFGLLVLEG